LRIGIAFSGGEAYRQRLLETGELSLAQVDVGRRGAFFEVAGGPGAWNRHDMRRPGERRGDRQRRRLHAPCLGELEISLEPVAVAPPVDALETRIDVAEILAVERLDRLQQPAEISASKRREGDQNRA